MEQVADAEMKHGIDAAATPDAANETWERSGRCRRLNMEQMWQMWQMKHGTDVAGAPYAANVADKTWNRCG